MGKQLHVNCFLVESAHAEAFRNLVREYNEPSSYEEHQANNYELPKPLVEILYEESSRGRTGFDLWFATPATGFYFGRAWGQREATLPAVVKPEPVTYPRFLYHPKLRTWLRYNSPTYFCIVSESQLQVRRERPQELFAAGEVVPCSETEFMEQYQRIRSLLHQRATAHQATYQHRGGGGDEWLYCNFIYAGGDYRTQPHLRLNATVDGYGCSWNLLYALDTNPDDTRRVASNQTSFEMMLDLLLQDADAAVAGQQEGGQQHG